MRPTLRRRLVVAAGALAIALAGPSAASAHLRTGTVAVDYRATLAQPRTSAFTARIYQSDRAVFLRVAPGSTVTLVGYLGEPVFRLGGGSLAVNAASPTAISAGVLPKSDRVAGTRVRWRVLRRADSVVWHDARAAGLPSGVSRGTWTIPLLVNGARFRLGGTLTRLRPPALWPWLALLAAFLAVGAGLPLARRPSLVRRAALAAGTAAALAAAATAIGFALDTYASPGTWIAGLDELALLAVGVGVLVWAPRNAHLPAAVGLGLLAVAVGLSKGAVFLHPIVLSAIPGTAARAATAVAIAAGVVGAVLGCVAFARAFDAERMLVLSGLRLPGDQPRAGAAGRAPR